MIWILLQLGFCTLGGVATHVRSMRKLQERIDQSRELIRQCYAKVDEQEVERASYRKKPVVIKQENPQNFYHPSDTVMAYYQGLQPKAKDEMAEWYRSMERRFTPKITGRLFGDE